jgi:hypothetical protein
MNWFSDFFFRYASMLGFKVKGQHLLLHSRYYGSQVFTSITKSSPQWNKTWVQNIKITRQQPRRWTHYVWYTLQQLHIASWYETKYRYLNSRRVGASCSVWPLEHACWRSKSNLWCIYRWQAPKLFLSYQYGFNRFRRQLTNKFD